MRSHPHNGVKVRLLVNVEGPRCGGEFGVFKELASLPQIPLDVAVAAAAPLPLPRLAPVNGPVPAMNRNEKL